MLRQFISPARYEGYAAKAWFAHSIFPVLRQAIDEPVGLVTRAGDRSIVVHWDRSPDPTLAGYRLYTAFETNGPFVAVNPAQLLISPSYAVVNATNGVTQYFQVAAVTNRPKPARTRIPSPQRAAVCRR